MITITKLTKKFGDIVAVDGLNVEINAQEIFGLLGPNGAGKTTSINMICGLLPPTGGTIRFDGDNGNARRSRIGYCPQENIFYPKLTCYEQLLFIGRMYGIGSSAAGKRACDILDLMGLSERTNAIAHTLSGGMKRRLNICLALMHDPDILILDEPEAGLDPQSRIHVRDVIRSFGKEKTVILTTHNMDEADRLADRIAIMDHGRLLQLDTPQNLKRTIGEGDILEVIFDQTPQDSLDRFAEQVSSISQNMKRSANCLLIKHPNVIGQLPAIKRMAETHGVAVSEIKLRENTLEDVFIHLTGRTLRQ